MNSHFKRWVREAVAQRTNKGAFTSHIIMGDIVDARGTSNSIGSVTAIGWYLSRLENVIKIKDGIYEVKK